jgi:hypothetical protein
MKYNKATELDMKKAHRVADNIFRLKDTHCLILALKELKLITTANASYAEHVDGKSHRGGTVSFLSDMSFHFCFCLK